MKFCEVCGDKLKPIRKGDKRPLKRFCSTRCRIEGLNSDFFTEERKKNLSKSGFKYWNKVHSGQIYDSRVQRNSEI